MSYFSIKLNFILMLTISLLINLKAHAKKSKKSEQIKVDVKKLKKAELTKKKEVVGSVDSMVDFSAQSQEQALSGGVDKTLNYLRHI